MALTEGDKDTIRVIAGEIGQNIGDALRENVEQMIALHQATCPSMRSVLASKWVLVGIGAALMVLTTGGSVLGELLLKIF